MTTMEGRDEAWSHRTMATLWQRATSLNLVPFQWHIGYFVLRDLVKTRNPNMRHNPIFERPDTVWGATINVVSLDDQISLVAIDPGTRNMRIFKAKEGK